MRGCGCHFLSALYRLCSLTEGAWGLRVELEASCNSQARPRSSVMTFGSRAMRFTSLGHRNPSVFHQFPINFKAFQGISRPKSPSKASQLSS